MYALDGELNDRKLFSEQTIDGKSASRISDNYFLSSASPFGKLPENDGTLKLARDTEFHSID